MCGHILGTELDITPTNPRCEHCIVPPADLRAVPHQRRDLEQTHTGSASLDLLLVMYTLMYIGGFEHEKRDSRIVASPFGSTSSGEGLRFDWRGADGGDAVPGGLSQGRLPRD